jgi:fatty-acyl-CoA synthase
MHESRPRPSQHSPPPESRSLLANMTTPRPGPRTRSSARASVPARWSDSWSPHRPIPHCALGILRTGAAVSVVPTPTNLGAGPVTATRVAAIAQAAGMRHLVLDPLYADIGVAVNTLLPDLVIVDPSAAAPGGARALPSVAPDDLAIVQFTSGSTSEPKGVLLPHRTTVAGLRACVVSGNFSPDDVYVQWVPIFHDMGLIGLLSHLLNGADVHLFAPGTFLRRPRGVLSYFAHHRGTVMAGPNFSYDHLLDAVDKDFLAGLDLSQWRLAFNGAEPVDAATVRRFSDVLAAAGVREHVMYPAYGMAEATLEISCPTPGSVANIVTVDRALLGAEGVARRVSADHPTAKELVSVGHPVEGMRLRVVDPVGRVRADGELGEIQISGPAVASGYFRAPELTAQAFDGPWFRTGDLGFRLGDDLFIGGRAKEMAIVRGQNFFPNDVEAIVRRTPGVYRGHCVAFSETDPDVGEHITIIVEARLRDREPEQLRIDVARRVAAELDLTHVRVHMVKPNWLPHTTSGKWQRVLARKWLAEESRLAATVPMTGTCEAKDNRHEQFDQGAVHDGH